MTEARKQGVMTAGELISRLSKLPASTELVMYPQVGGGVQLCPTKDGGEIVIWEDPFFLGEEA